MKANANSGTIPWKICWGKWQEDQESSLTWQTIHWERQQHCSIQGHPTDRLHKLSVRKAFNPLWFSWNNCRLEFSWYDKFNVCCFWSIKNVVLGTEEKVSYHFRKGDKNNEMDKKSPNKFEPEYSSSPRITEQITFLAQSKISLKSFKSTPNSLKQRFTAVEIKQWVGTRVCLQKT